MYNKIISSIPVIEGNPFANVRGLERYRDQLVAEYTAERDNFPLRSAKGDIERLLKTPAEVFHPFRIANTLNRLFPELSFERASSYF